MRIYAAARGGPRLLRRVAQRARDEEREDDRQVAARYGVEQRCGEASRWLCRLFGLFHPLFRNCVPLIPDIRTPDSGYSTLLSGYPYPLLRLAAHAFPLFRLSVPVFPLLRSPYRGYLYPFFRSSIPLIQVIHTPLLRFRSQ